MRAFRLLALSAALLGVAAAQAQAPAGDAFPDTPANHWAYEALARMKRDGLLVGYPDGLFRGGRPASRYELAVAMHAVYTKLKNITEGLDAQVRALQSPTRDWQGMKDAIAAMAADLAAFEGYGDEIANLRRATDTFEKELTQLGVDVQAMKDDLGDLAGRVRALENKKAPLEVSGRFDMWVGGGHGLDGRYGLNRDGRIEGVLNKGVVDDILAAGNRAGITRDAAVLSELATTVTSTTPGPLRFTGTFVATNAFGQSPVGGVVASNVGFGNQSDPFNPASGGAGQPAFFGYADGQGDAYIQELVASFTGARVNVDAGRIRHRATNWIFQRLDNTLYFDNDRWDDGRYTFDGLRANTHFGPVGFEAYAGKTDSVQTVNGLLLNPLRSGPANGAFAGDAARLTAQRLLGGTLTGRLGSVGLRGDYVVLDTSGLAGATIAQAFDHVDVFGGEADLRLGRLALSGGLRQTKAYANDVRVGGFTDSAWDAKAAYASGRFDVRAQYREVGTNYLAPGDWGRLGILRNPTNVRGFLGDVGYGFARRFRLGLQGEYSLGLGNDASDVAGTFLDRDTHIRRYGVRLDAALTGNLGAYVNYEETTFTSLANPDIDGDPRYRWYGVGLGLAMAPNARFTLAYEQSAVRSDYQTTVVAGNSFRGGFLTTQLTVKF